MHIAGIIESNNTQEVIDTIKYFLSFESKKVSFSEYGYRFRNKQTWNDYCSALNQIGTEILIIKIKTVNIDDALNILPLNTLIVNNYSDWNTVLNKIRSDRNNYFKELTIILNCDVIKSSNFTDVKKCRVLCYGFNSDSNITTSSTGEPSISGQFLCCIRNSLISANGKNVEPQEYVMNFENVTIDPYNILAAASFAVLHDVNLNKLNGKN